MFFSNFKHFRGRWPYLHKLNISACGVCCNLSWYSRYSSSRFDSVLWCIELFKSVLRNSDNTSLWSDSVSGISTISFSIYGRRIIFCRTVLYHLEVSHCKWKCLFYCLIEIKSVSLFLRDHLDNKIICPQH